MKMYLTLFLILIFSISKAQDCNNYFYLQNNKTIEMTIYNKKGSPNGKQVISVSDVKNGGSTVSAVVNTEMLDKKGKSIAKGITNIRCSNGIMMMDMKMMLPQQQAEQFKDMEARSKEYFIEYPSGMSVGDVLKDGEMNLEMDNNGIKQSIFMQISNRKVNSRESITTSAGTWDCFKISYQMKMNMKMAGIGVPMNIDGVEWFAPGFGVVKTESKHGSTAITSIR